MSKKAVFFTFMAIFVVILIVTVVSTRNRFRYREKSFVISTRVRAMDNFIKDMENDLNRELFIGGYRALLSLQKYIRMKQGFIGDLDGAFAEIFINGTANGTAIDIMKQEGQGADFTSWTERINEEANKLNINVFFEPLDVSLSMDSPLSVLISFTVFANVSDTKDLAFWEYNKTFTESINITGFEDPLYTVESNDKISNLIYLTPSTDFVEDATNDTTNLKIHLNNSYYVNSTKGPDFLMRFTGNLSNSTFGIESMVNLDLFQKQGLGIRNKTLIDYIYFSNLTTSDYCDVDDMLEWFRIDSGHSSFYEVNKLEKSWC
ncbi:hypothetical protein JXB41_04425 [Candidatus Woesearchaeota archaeon]|nr:hypothetical protein [Candidatus Woesearchaeota archaeon]